MSKAATMEIPINSNGDTGPLPEDDSLEQVGESYCISWQYTGCDHPMWLLFNYLKLLHKQINVHTVSAYWLCIQGQQVLICYSKSSYCAANRTVYSVVQLFIFLFIYLPIYEQSKNCLYIGFLSNIYWALFSC